MRMYSFVSGLSRPLVLSHALGGIGIPIDLRTLMPLNDAYSIMAEVDADGERR